MAVEVTMQVKGMPEIRRKLESLTPAEMKRATKRAHSRIELNVLRTAKDYTPISPKKSQFAATLVGKVSKQTTFNPGGLMRSIRTRVTTEFMEIFVASGSEGSKYARKVHEKEGITQWGPGTIAKGPQAKEQFMTRSIRDNEKNIVVIYNGEIKKSMRRLNA